MPRGASIARVARKHLSSQPPKSIRVWGGLKVHPLPPGGFLYLSYMSNGAKISAECLTPILYVRDFAEAMKYYTEKLLFDRLWEWGEPPDFGAVRLGNVEIFLLPRRPGPSGKLAVDFHGGRG